MENHRHPQPLRVRALTAPLAWSKPWLSHACALMALSLAILFLVV